MPTISKKKLIFLIFGMVKRKKPRAVGKNRRILDQNLVVKDEVFSQFKEFKALIENHTEKKTKTFQLDNGG